MKIIVIGAGIVGLSTAYWLARDGHAVTVIDRADAVGQGASFANGGQLSYSYVAPLASPSVLRQLPKWLLGSNSPIKFRPTAGLGQLRWVLSFLMACTDRRSRATTEILLSLAELSRRALDELIERERIAFNHRRNGKIVFYSTRASLDAALRQHAIQAELGSCQTVLGREECLDLEPSLASAADRLVGAIYTPSEEVGDCLLLCEELRRVLEQAPYHVEFRLHAEVRELVGDRRRVRAVRFSGETVEADLYAVCAGSDSRRLLLKFGLALPVYPIRGYSLSAAVENPAAAPVRSITDHENRIVYACIGDILRVAGFADIVSGGAPPDAGRMAALSQAVATLFPDIGALADPHPWVGSRPATPTSVPVIGFTHCSNLLVNVGQGSLGFTLGSGSGRMMADIVAGRRAGVNESDFALPSLRRSPLRSRAAA